jgi:hypothetical protein
LLVLPSQPSVLCGGNKARRSSQPPTFELKQT